ncbi:glycoside hydrolase family 76 protein [Ascoidea rubescens DSM 1968]|uniref:Mannan endo-1,6-alpha-mannosidase n=1 Tax=Ascoidea rubescens DSM 1968 TaxID=1344418 RepID=A0A1D2VB95_9ASCO|nr:glycoside hydrolase family 76 protein [Ascoidea rubescens DSM 1968]ODV58879.1 glycoside hydrolase family 76 protein [Ascoidea rubescens DSM 1968]
MLSKFLLSSFSILAAYAIDLDTSSKDSICSAVSTISDGILDYYLGTRYGGNVGMFQQPYYWWQAGEAFGSLLDQWYLCEDKTNEQLLYDALVSQTGDNYDYVPLNQTETEGNDDQGVWSFAIMSAAEKGFPSPKNSGVPYEWVELAENIFNSMFGRWDDECGGGLRWQIYDTNVGFDYKNSVSNGCLFQLAARLAKYHNDPKYTYIADYVWEWTTDVDFLTEYDDTIILHDGAHTYANCEDITDKEWTYNYGLYMVGSAYLYNYTGEQRWLDRTNKLLHRSNEIFFNNNVMYEQQCQRADSKSVCNNDQRSFKSLFSRCLGLTSVLAPSTRSTIESLIEASAKGAAASCSGGSDGVTCGIDWTMNSWDGWYGLGEQMSAIEVIQNLLIADRPAPLTASST